MTLHGNFGKVKKTYEEFHFEWKINFRNIAEDENFEYCESPRFAFENASWFLQLWWKSKLKPECMSLCLSTTNQLRNMVEYNLSFKALDSKQEQLVTGILRENHTHSGCCFLKRSKLIARKCEMFIILCTLTSGIFLSTQEQILSKPKTKEIIDDGAIYEDYKKVFTDGQNKDLILNFGDREFSVHRDILCARSSAFKAMLSRNMKENSDTINIYDCDPQTMEQLLLYVYSGELETLNENNMIGLYYAADKYNMINLKKECRTFINESLSPINICGVIQFALNHSDSDLLEHATEYFCNNSQKIVRTVEWQSFLKDNTATANGLLIKSFDKLANVKI